jgi:hypothetical protein
MVDHPGELSDTLEQFIFASDMKDGHMYKGRNHVGDFKKEDGQIWYRGFLPDDKWQQVSPHPKSLFKPDGFIRDIEEDINSEKLRVMMDYTFKQIKGGYTEGYYPRWELTEDENAWTIKISKQGAM